jgi:CHAT domain-containing protein
MSFLPIHAAGIYGDGESESILDYAVSSYTPTIAALTDRVKNTRLIHSTVSGLFLTSQPKAPDACEIPGTVMEVSDIHDKAVSCGVRAVRVVGDELSVQGCLEHMKDFSSVHLACHASQNADDPLKSRFLLHKGEVNLETIIQMDLKDADLAFLSACQTGTGEENLSDEAVHLAAGMLAAGYRRVVATMWSIKDDHAPSVAKDFYEYLWRSRAEDSGSGFDGSISAHALHHAVQQLRHRLDNSEASLLTWAPYVHFGY